MVPVLEAAPGAGMIGASVTIDQRSTLVLATDGTTQSEHAIDIARLVGARTKSDIRVLTVVDELPVPWGTPDSASAIEYERSLRAEALDTVRRQIQSFGDSKWPIDVRSGDPAETITARAVECDAKLAVVGLGGHGGTARLFGSETSLRLARVSRTPVLAVEPHLTYPPKRILVAMDFSEASIEAARLALELADESGSMVLAHVVPWRRTPYVPEEWIRTHEESVSSQMSRVIGWLNRQSPFRIGQRILYGRPGHTLLKYAEELDADLIATGTHGRSGEKRLLGGQTVDKLIRGARCSVLVFPAAAAFQRKTAPSEVTLKPVLQDVG
ncbi:MAG: universal stress protein [Gemmatimonadaceae bacterium]